MSDFDFASESIRSDRDELQMVPPKHCGLALEPLIRRRSNEIPRLSGFETPSLENSVRSGDFDVDDSSIFKVPAAFAGLVGSFYFQAEQVSCFSRVSRGTMARWRLAFVVFVVGIEEPVRRILNFKSIFSARIGLPAWFFSSALRIFDWRPAIGPIGRGTWPCCLRRCHTCRTGSCGRCEGSIDNRSRTCAFCFARWQCNSDYCFCLLAALGLLPLAGTPGERASGQ